jgi:hypothetical protein
MIFLIAKRRNVSLWRPIHHRDVKGNNGMVLVW